MSFKVKCPHCGKSFESSSTGRLYCEPICQCYHKKWCSVVDGYVCGNDTTCEGCSEDYGSCSPEIYCTGGYGEHCCSGVCPYVAGCDCHFYFHPILKKNIYCPECGSFDVNVKDSSNIWDFKCNSCEHEFSLKNKDDEKIKRLRKYKQLFDEGILTQEEFDKKKKEILG
ncbi:MAG: SHOCT domain-containing protein [Spirochaetales bacterium]|nr:SHOCT domain-containing protein [Spirochaetales bacterium]